MKSTLRILHLEDDNNDAELIASMIKAEGLVADIVIVETEEDFIAALDRGCFDIILTDYKLPSYDGLSALDAARERCPDIPFIFVSGAMGEERAIDALKRGATDYVLKNNLKRLIPAIKRAISEAEEIAKRMQAEESINKLNESLEQKVIERTNELKKTIAQIEELNRVFIGRELKMAELKEHIAELEKRVKR